MADPLPRALLGLFDTPEALVAAARLARDRGIRGLDAYTPFPVEGLDQALAIARPPFARIASLGGGAGLVVAYAMQVATNLAYPLDIGGRPLVSMQSFALIGFELTVLGAVGSMAVGFFLLNRLPRFHQALFWVDRFERATRDGFFLSIGVEDKVSLRAAKRLLKEAGAIAVDPVPR